MPTQTSYPGVYIEEVPSGVRTITGVATSITAFIGRALKGLVNEPVVITSFADYERQFGGLWEKSTMSYAVQDFYLNGGSVAVIVRLYTEPDLEGGEEDDEDDDEDDLEISATGVAEFSMPDKDDTADALVLTAVSPGAWANNLVISVNDQVKDPTSEDDAPEGLFNLVVSEKNGEITVPVETYLRVSVAEDNIRNLSRILEESSTRLRVKGTPTAAPKSSIGGDNKDNPYPATLAGSDGGDLTDDNYLPDQGASKKIGLHAFLRTDLFNLLCVPPPVRGGNTSSAIYTEAVKLCVDRRAVLIVDPIRAWGETIDGASKKPKDELADLGVSGIFARNAALYYPLIRKPDPKRAFQSDLFVPCGAVAGVMARTDTTRGVWKSPAGIDAALAGVDGLQVNLSDAENGLLNPFGINCLRSFPITGRVVWGARTLRGADVIADEYKYVAVRRTALYIEESLYRGTQWVVFEPNDEPLWAQIRLNVGAFMHNLFRQGAFQGKTPREAYLVKCDKETTTQTDINSGIVNILVGFAPLKPAEFVIIKLQQLAGQIES